MTVVTRSKLTVLNVTEKKVVVQSRKCIYFLKKKLEELRIIVAKLVTASTITIYLFIILSIYPFIYLSICIFIYLSIDR